MTLITDAKDERLKHGRILTESDLTPFRDSLRAALSRAEKAESALRSVAGAVGEFADADGKNIVEKIKFLRKDWEERITKAEAALCRAREVLEEVKESVCQNCWFLDFHNVRHVRHTTICKTITAVLSSSAPCRHAVIAERVEDTEGMSRVIRHGMTHLDIARAVQKYLRGKG